MYSNGGLFGRRRPPPPKHLQRAVWAVITAATVCGMILYLWHLVYLLTPPQAWVGGSGAGSLHLRKAREMVETGAPDIDIARVDEDILRMERLQLDLIEKQLKADAEALGLEVEGGTERAVEGGKGVPREQDEAEPWQEAMEQWVKEQEDRVAGQALVEAAALSAEQLPQPPQPPPEPPAPPPGLQRAYVPPKEASPPPPGPPPGKQVLAQWRLQKAASPPPPATRFALIFTMDGLSDYVANSRTGGPAGEIIVRESLEWGLRQLGVEPVVAASDADFARLSATPDNFQLFFLDPWTFVDPGACVCVRTRARVCVCVR